MILLPILNKIIKVSIARLYKNIIRIDKYLVNGVDLHIKLFRNTSAFDLMSKEASHSYNLQLLDMVFKTCMINVDSGI